MYTNPIEVYIHKGLTAYGRLGTITGGQIYHIIPAWKLRMVSPTGAVISARVTS